MLNNFIDGAFVINLDHRPDRLREFNRRAAEVGLNVERFASIKVDDQEVFRLMGSTTDTFRSNRISCTLSHVGAIRLAQERGYKRVLIFEDDAQFMPEFSNFKTYLNELETIKNWSVCYLGGSPEPDFPTHSGLVCKKITENIYYNPGAMWGAHAYIVNSQFYDTFLNSHPRYHSLVDNMIFPFDYNLIYFPQTERRYFMTKKLLVTQDDSLSDLTGDRFSRTKIYQDNYEKQIHE